MLLVNGAVKKFGMCYFRTVLFLMMLGGEDLGCLVLVILILYRYPYEKDDFISVFRSTRIVFSYFGIRMGWFSICKFRVTSLLSLRRRDK